MSRPEKLSDVEDRTIQIAKFELNLISTNPTLMKSYVALIEAVQKQGGEAKPDYNGVVIYMPRNREQLQEQLRRDQYVWDDTEKLYNRVISYRQGEDVEDVPSYTHDRIKEWAKEEALPDPFEVEVA